MDSSKLQIYKGMIQYLLRSTNYTIKNIADLSYSPTKHIKSIYFNDLIPPDFSSELQLVNLYHIILELKINKREFSK